MKCIAFCSIGIEDILEIDIKEILGKDCDKKKGCCLFDADKKEIAKFSYLSQSIEKIGVLLGEGKIKDDPDTISIEKIDFDIKNVYTLNCSIIGKKNFKSNEVVEATSGKINKKTGKKFTFKAGDIDYFIMIIDTDYYFILDLAVKELSKRDYKVFVNKTSLRGTLAYAVGRIAEVSSKENVLDCFCRSGEIGLEIMHKYIGKSVHFYTKDRFNFKKYSWNVNLEEFDNIDEKGCTLNCTDAAMPNLKAAEKNAKIAGMNKLIKFSRIIIEDLDLKFEDVDKIVIQLPAIGKDSEQRVLRLYRDFFMVSKKIIANKGTITCIGLNIEKVKEIAELEGYKCKHERGVMQGKEAMKVFVFQNEASGKSSKTA